MSWRGDGPPVFVVDGTAHTFPFPVAGSIEESWDPEESRIVTRRNGERVHLSRRWRFRAKYSFSSLSAAQIGLLKVLRNTWPRIVVTVRPHSDVTVLQAPCWIDDESFEEIPDGPGAHDLITVAFTGVTPFTGTQVPDLSVTMHTDLMVEP